MSQERESLNSIAGANRSLRRKLGLKGELFGLAVGITALLVGLERFALWMLARYTRQ